MEGTKKREEEAVKILNKAGEFSGCRKAFDMTQKTGIKLLAFLKACTYFPDEETAYFANLVIETIADEKVKIDDGLRDTLMKDYVQPIIDTCRKSSDKEYVQLAEDFSRFLGEEEKTN